MAFDITFDYRFDTTGFFDPSTSDGAAARAALEKAAEIWESVIGDEFEDVPAGISFSVTNPSDRDSKVTVTLDESVDDLLIFVGADQLGGALGRAGPSTAGAEGDILRARVDDDFRGQGPVTDFEPWAGSATFNPDTDWSFALEGPVAGKADFISTALHEIAHVLGFGTAPAFDALISGTTFMGVNARAENGGAGVPLDGGLGHVAEGFDGDMVLMDPMSTIGTRTLPSALDKAILADIGYEIAGFIAQGSQPEVTTEGSDDPVFGTVIGDWIDGMGGNDRIQGDDGDDTIRGGAGTDIIFGQGGADTFVLGKGDGINTVYDFEVSSDMIRLLDSRFETTAQALAAVTRPFSNVSRITLSDGSRLDVFDGGRSLSEANFELSSSSVQPVSGGGGNDALEGTAAGDEMRGFGGDDTLLGGAGDDEIRGDAGDDFLRGDAGSDTVNGGAGNDKIFAGPSDDAGDLLDGGLGNDTIGGATGDDTITGGDGADEIFGGAGADDISGGADNDTIWAGSGNDLVLGDDGDDILGGGEGQDSLSGGNGADVFYGGRDAGADLILGEAGADTIFGGGGDDDISGGAGNDVIYNGGGSDTVTGGTGADEIWGSGGDDLLSGGADADTFAFDSGNGDDRVTDFTLTEDRIRIAAEGVTSFDQLLLSDGASGAVVAFADVTVTLEGVSAAALGEEDFIFG